MTPFQRIQNSFNQILEFAGPLLAALVILFAGYLVARLVQRGAELLLRRIGFRRFLERGGVMEAVERSGAHLNPVRGIANLVFWLVMFGVLMVASSALGLSLEGVFPQLMDYAFRVMVAMAIIVVGTVVGEFVGELILASAGAVHGGTTIARIGRAGVIILAVFLGLEELGIESSIVTTAFAILFGAVALAMALAFGLGNRELAGEVTREWYERYRAQRDTIEREVAAVEAAEESESIADELEASRSDGGVR